MTLALDRPQLQRLLHPRRPRLIGLCVVIALLLGGCGALLLGETTVTVSEVIATVLGQGTSRQELLILQWRLPRILLALIVGMALGLSGSIFQTLTGNPLGSPDLIGFSVGATTGILVAVLWTGASAAVLPLAALCGGLATAVVIYLISMRYGFQGFRLVLCGIALSAMLAAVNRFLIVQADITSAQGAQRLISGSLNGANWSTVAIAAAWIIPGTLAVWMLSGTLRDLSLGADVAQALGVPLTQSRALLVLLGAGLVAAATTAAGPIAFVALAAPHIARGLAKNWGPSPLLAGLLGAALLLGADALGLALPVSLPVGVITTSLGGMYLLGLLVSEMRKK